MVTLPRLEDYAAADLARAAELSPAFADYRRRLEQPDLDPFVAERHRAWLTCAAATLLDKGPAADVCAYWSEVADHALRTAWRTVGLDQWPAALFALGKLGAGELNLSSDVDLLVVAEPEALAQTTRAVRALQRLVADSGCFRLDFDLRPGGTQGSLVPTPAQFQDHYWSQGETWERLAMVRLRPLTGPAHLTTQIEDLARRYSYRKYLDYTLLEDLKVLRAAVHQRGFVRRPNEVHLKLEVGGIRDVELFVHAQQVLNGGKVPGLRTRSTTAALERLSEHGILDPTTADALNAAYWRLREVENYVQALDDRQTHVLPETDPRTPGVRSTMRDVDAIVSGLLGAVDLSRARLPLAPTEQSAWLLSLGFAEPTIRDEWPKLLNATALGLRTDRDERARRECLYAFVQSLATHPDRDLGLRLLTDFVRATRTKATFYSTLLRVPQLIEDLARLFCRAPYSGAILAARPELLDHLIRPVTDAWAEDPAELLSQLAERRQLTELWAATHLLARGDLDQLLARVTQTADQIATELLRQLHVEYPGGAVRILTLGKWGGGELGLRSDLDFIFVSDQPPGPREFRLARRFITRLTDPGKTGALYDVDLRLRPSGQSGPLMVTPERLTAYWRDDAAPWERQAYLRARPLDGGAIDRAALVHRPLTDEDLRELLRIRRALLRPATTDVIDLKHAPGGFIDVEFTAQTALLKNGWVDAPTSTLGMIAYLSERDPKWRAEGAAIAAAYQTLRDVEQHVQLASVHRLSELRANDEAFARAAAGLNQSAAELWREIEGLTQSTRRRLNTLDPTGLIL